jgi:hypothetical protein
VTVTFKAGTGFDAPWIVIHAADIADAHAQVRDKALSSLMEDTAKMAEFFTSFGRPSGPRQPAAAATTNAAPAASGSETPAHQQAPGGVVKRCDHGQKIYKTGFSEKTKKTWHAFDCPTKQCDPPREWYNPGGGRR